LLYPTELLPQLANPNTSNLTKSAIGFQLVYT
jgi:hypothetical protein